MYSFGEGFILFGLLDKRVAEKKGLVWEFARAGGKVYLFKIKMWSGGLKYLKIQKRVVR